jgi:hypothetical protein
MTANRRHFSRIAFRAPAQLTFADRHIDVSILDLSLNGGLVLLPAGQRARIGENCTLQMPLGDAVTQIRMQGAVAHIEGPSLGLACRNLDLDSATHLRRLVELNLGDPQLLERELSALVGEEPA